MLLVLYALIEPVFFSAADLMVAPYLWGSRSGAVKLALGLGLPVVITEQVADDVLSNRPDVSIVPPGDAAQLANGIVEMVNKGQSTHQAPVNNDWERVVNATEAMARPAG